MPEPRRAVVTGGDRGIGFGIAADLVATGATHVAIVGRDDDALNDAATELRVAGTASVSAFRADLAEPHEVAALCESLVSSGTQWNVLVHSAGNPPAGPLLDMDPAFFSMTHEIHVSAAFRLAQALAPGMIDQQFGRIVAIGSTAGSRAFRSHGAYCPAKAGLTMLMQCYALEWGEFGITANTIAPTVILTKLGQEVWGQHPDRAEWIRNKIPVGRLGEVDDVVAAARFLISDGASFVNGSTIQCDGGQISTVADGPPA